MRVRVSIRTIWATRFAAGLSAAISASLRFPLQSLSPPLAGARCALRLPKSTPRRAEVPDTMPNARFALLATALRAALVADLASLALAGCAGCGNRLRLGPVHPCAARCRTTPAHRLAHHPTQYSPHSCGRSCGARPHFAPHRAVHWCPHDCGHRRLRLRQRAAHDCLRLPPHRPPLNRRGGSPPPASPASIPQTLMQQAWPS